MKSKITIGVLYYLKEDTYIQSDTLLPIQLGYNETGVDMGIQRDSIGENRSNRHPIYSEYSGIYWLWKNVHSTYKGVFHHRRGLVCRRLSPTMLLNYIYVCTKTRLKCLIKNVRASWSPVIKCTDHLNYVEVIHKSSDYLPKLFEQGYDIIAPFPFHFIGYTVYDCFDEVVNRELMSIIKTILKNDYDSFYEIFLTSLNDTKMYYANISVMKEDLFDEYCEFVFGVFDKLEQILITENYYLNLYKEKSMYRIFGYIGELLTNVYIRKKKIDGYKIKELCLLYDSSVKGNENTDYSKIKL